MNRYALAFGIIVGLAEPTYATLTSQPDEQRFYQDACRGSPWGEKKCVQRLKAYCAKPNKWQDGEGKWRDGPSARQRELCYQLKT